MTNYFLSKDWRKQASMTATNDLDIEKAFSDQASGFVENKVGDLMKDQYRVGFEIVKKNDDNTRMVGVFAFKVENDLIFAPVFFLNGEIKGPLLYRCNTKTFVPANKEWSSFLIESMETEEGKGRDRSRRIDGAPLVQMQRITFRPPGLSKGAAANEQCCCRCKCIKKNLTPEAPGTYKVEADYNAKPGGQPRVTTGEETVKLAAWDDGTIRIELDGGHYPMTVEDANNILQASWAQGATITVPGKAAFTIGPKEVSNIKSAFFKNVPNNAEQWAGEMLDMVEKSSSERGLIREFLEEPGFGLPAAELLLKAASGREGYEFANMLAGIYGSPANLIPESFETLEKSASVSTEPELVIHYDSDGLDKQAAVSPEFFQDGFYITDKRPEETLSVVWDTTPDSLGAPKEPGEYSVLMNDGTFTDNVFVAKPYRGSFGGASIDMADVGIGGINYGDYDLPTLGYICVKDGKAAVLPNVLCTMTKGARQSSMLKDKVEEKKVYYIYIDKSESLIGPVAISSVKTVDGVQYCKASYRVSSDGGKWDATSVSTYTKAPLTINPDLSTSLLDEAVLGADARFLEVDVELGHEYKERTERQVWEDGGRLNVLALKGLGSANSIDNWIFSTWSMPKVTVLNEVNAVKEAAFRFSDGKRVSDPMNKCVAMVKLARDMGIAATKAYELLSDARKDGQRSFYLQPTEKVASRLRVIDRPNFDEEFDSEFGVPLQPAKAYALRVQGDQDFEPPSAIGDAMNPTSVTGLPNLTVASTSPEDLRALADTYHLPNVFEHGVIGTLADTFNALVLVDKYIPKIEDGVDALGRIKFLLHWCPSDFEKAYGSDDMTNLEAEIDSNFESQGALLLKLLKKSDKLKKNTDRAGFTE